MRQPDKRAFRPEVVDQSRARYPDHDTFSRQHPPRRGFLELFAAAVASSALLGFKGGGCMPVPRAPRDLKNQPRDGGVEAATKKTPLKQPTSQPSAKPDNARSAESAKPTAGAKPTAKPTKPLPLP